ncbi:MAG: hypothetical protein AAFR96_00125 [Planctomycetota bacterium]
MTRTSVAATALALTLVVSTSGCIHGSSVTSESGVRVGSTTFSRIEPGVTTKDWIRTTLGEPQRRSVSEGGRELWVYDYERTERSRGTFLLVIGGSDTSTTSTVTYVEFKDGVVTQAWQD